MHAAHQTPMVRRKSYVKSTEEWEEEDSQPCLELAGGRHNRGGSTDGSVDF